jgi:Fic family protein
VVSEVEKERQFGSLEELMEYVEKEARRRVEEMSSKYTTAVETEPYDQAILRLLRESEEPMSVELISFLTGISKSRCCKVLRKLEEKWSLVRKVTVSKVAYYVAAT